MNIYEATVEFINAHKEINIEKIAEKYGSVSQYLDYKSLNGNCGERYLKINKHDTISGIDELIEWKDSRTYRIYHTEATVEFINAHGVLYDFDVAINEALKLLADPDADNVTLIEYLDGQTHEVIDLKEYME